MLREKDGGSPWTAAHLHITPTSSTSTWTEAEQEEFGKLDESEQIQQIYDFMKSQSEKRQADREFLASQAQVVIKEKLSKISDELNTWGNKLLLLLIYEQPLSYGSRQLP